MEIVSSYKVQILDNSSIFNDTIRIYRSALSFLISVFDAEWDALHSKKAKERFNVAEHLVHGTKHNIAKYDFDARFHKMPSYLRRAVIQEALGSVSSYRSNHANWEKDGRQGKEPKLQAEHLAMPTFYNKEMYCASDDPCAAYLKLFFNNDWVWVKVRLRGTDVRRLNDELAKKISSAIIDFAVLYSVDCIVFEYLDFRGRKAKGSKAQRLHMWRKNGIQQYVEHKAHRCGIHISRICAWGTSKLAYDGSGEVVRDETNRALCAFQSGKRYNCDLSASYNIGARYFVRELLKPLPVTVRSDLWAKIPDAQRRTSCTLSTLRAMTAAMQEAA